MDKETLLKFIYRILRYNYERDYALSQLLDVLEQQNAPDELQQIVSDLIPSSYDASVMVKENGKFTEADIEAAKKRREQRLEQERYQSMYGRC